MWWNNVETKPGTGYPVLWEDQDRYKGGWEEPNGELRLKSQTRSSALFNIFHNPTLPSIDDYYEPWTYEYQKLTDAPASDDQPTARPISLITGKYMEIESGPNWDDDLAGSPLYASADPNWAALAPEQKKDLFAIERLVFFHLPRTCNHCLNPACVAACPSGALHKRAEDGIVLVDQDRCRGWRHCVAACPYKKAYFNWDTGKSEKCILCYPRVEVGEAPACFHSCPGRIRFVGVLLYDADSIHATAGTPRENLIERHRNIILDPSAPDVIRAAQASGISADVIEAAQRSPVFKFVKQWRLALPLHIEFRTLPMLFYIPPLSPVVHGNDNDAGLFADIDAFRIPLRYLASLFAAGNEEPVRYSLRKQQAVRQLRRGVTTGDIDVERIAASLSAADCTPVEADDIFRLTNLSTASERFVIPPLHREAVTETAAAARTGQS
jgi:nitrate reductase beta subunit